MKLPLRLTITFLLLVAALAAGELRVLTMNCYLDFRPDVVHAGQVAGKNPLSATAYRRKTENLASIARGYDLVAVQEIGGKEETQDLAQAAGLDFAYAAGKDTYTGEQVALLYRRQAGWTFKSLGRVPALDKLLSKHVALSVRAPDGREFVVLCCHLIRPIGAAAEKHAAQISGINQWVAAEAGRHPSTIYVVAGDTNDSARRAIFTFGSEVNGLNGWAATHLANAPFDRIALSGPAGWNGIEVHVPPYGRRPNDENKSLWTDHWPVGGTLKY